MDIYFDARPRQKVLETRWCYFANARSKSAAISGLHSLVNPHELTVPVSLAVTR